MHFAKPNPSLSWYSVNDGRLLPTHNSTTFSNLQEGVGEGDSWEGLRVLGNVGAPLLVPACQITAVNFWQFRTVISQLLDGSPF